MTALPLLWFYCKCFQARPRIPLLVRRADWYHPPLVPTRPLTVTPSTRQPTSSCSWLTNRTPMPVASVQIDTILANQFLDARLLQLTTVFQVFALNEVSTVVSADNQQCLSFAIIAIQSVTNRLHSKFTAIRQGRFSIKIQNISWNCDLIRCTVIPPRSSLTVYRRDAFKGVQERNCIFYIPT